MVKQESATAMWSRVPIIAAEIRDKKQSELQYYEKSQMQLIF